VNIYESERLLSEYLLFHYGAGADVLPYDFGPKDALDFPVRCVSQGLEPTTIPPRARALDLGCAVGRSSFELTRHCAEVVGVDYSRGFISAARQIKEKGELRFARIDEGELTTTCIARLPAEINRERVQFEPGDAMNLRDDIGQFDVLLAANLLCRLSDPAKCLRQFALLLNHGGQLIITSPGTWLEEFTPREKWLGGFERNGKRVSTLDGLKAVLEKDFALERTLNMPFLIREHARKFQWSVAQASIWTRR
jgi:putative 4-mercaptohistidine N1-methyltranferase